MPRYCILNCLDETVYLSQHNSEKYSVFRPYKPDPWYSIDGSRGTTVQIRTQSSIWSLGVIDLNELGASVVYLPHKTNDVSWGADGEGRTAGNCGLGGVLGGSFSGGVVVHVEVRMAERADNCSLIVILWRETVASRTSLLIQNDAEEPITLRQAGEYDDS